MPLKWGITKRTPSYKESHGKPTGNRHQFLPGWVRLDTIGIFFTMRTQTRNNLPREQPLLGPSRAGPPGRARSRSPFPWPGRSWEEHGRSPEQGLGSALPLC